MTGYSLFPTSHTDTPRMGSYGAGTRAAGLREVSGSEDRIRDEVRDRERKGMVQASQPDPSQGINQPHSSWVMAPVRLRCVDLRLDHKQQQGT